MKEIGNLPKKEFKVMVRKMFTNLGRRMDEFQQRDGKYMKVPNGSHRAKEYNN